MMTYAEHITLKDNIKGLCYAYADKLLTDQFFFYLLSSIHDDYNCDIRIRPGGVRLSVLSLQDIHSAITDKTKSQRLRSNIKRCKPNDIQITII